ncbi:hypothetical protein [Natronorubrum aibiense]|uniref:Type I restriction enzyme R protein N-terminal domain-containing protein n=1 Tax=Natronorubrum aibiense TaxID=348826 RepID=A0A5P9P493_9EURY|nr:hypothetical protein [Natronorubrum aibiense]QFU82975.1 hypothetical protein GCU68_10740 [Natronorubrum aibiense]
MSTPDLRAFISRSRALVDSTPPTTGRETRAWLVDPFLETLGWDIHSDTCMTEMTVDGTALEYVCSVDGIPALFVATEPFDASLEKARAVSLLETMAWTGVDRAIYTNGRTFLFLAGTTDVEQLACRRSSLPDHEAALAHYSHERLSRHLEHHARTDIARQLAVERTALADSIVAELVATTEGGDAYRSEFESAADRFLEQLVASFAETGSGRSGGALEAPTESNVSIQFSETEISDGDSPAVDRQPEPMGDSNTSHEDIDENSATESTKTLQPSETDASDRTDSATPTTSGDDHANEPDDSDATDDGEYVVRFFNDRTSIGAIGHSSSAQALVGVAEYLFDRGLSGVSVPWQPDEAADGRAVLNDAPTHADGTPMTAPQQLSNGLYLETAGDVDTRAARVEALVARAGLRAMLTGDWEQS